MVYITIIIAVASFIAGFFIGKNKSNSTNFNKVIDSEKGVITDTATKVDSTLTK